MKNFHQFSFLRRLLQSAHQSSDALIELREEFTVFLGPASVSLLDINVCQTISELIPESVLQVRPLSVWVASPILPISARRFSSK